MSHRKPSRYETAHRALLDRSGNLPPEISPEDLKIQILERATAFLRTQVQEAQEYGEKLRQCLADRDTQLREYQGYQREKWRTDHRLAALMVLTESVQVAPQAVPQNSRYETTSLPARKRANLSSFFQRGSCKAPLRFNCAITGKALERRVLKQVSPLLLRPSATPTRVNFLPVPDNLPPLYARRKQSEKMVNTQEELWASPSTSVTEEAFTPDLSPNLSPNTLPHDVTGTTHDGIALIHSPILRSKDEITAEIGDISLPAYVSDLLDDLDYIHDKIPLRPGSSALDLSPFSDVFSSALLVTPSDWDYTHPGPAITSPRRTTTVRIPDRRLADVLLTSPEAESTPRRCGRGRSHNVSLDPAIFKDDFKSDKLGDVAPIRHSSHVATEEERRKPRRVLRKKSSGVLSVSGNLDRRGEKATPTTRRSKSIASMIKSRMSAINKFR